MNRQVRDAKQHHDTGLSGLVLMVLACALLLVFTGIVGSDKRLKSEIKQSISQAWASVAGK